jgi:hypothetical protein
MCRSRFGLIDARELTPICASVAFGAASYAGAEYAAERL